MKKFKSIVFVFCGFALLTNSCDQSSTPSEDFELVEIKEIKACTYFPEDDITDTVQYYMDDFMNNGIDQYALEDTAENWVGLSAKFESLQLDTLYPSSMKNNVQLYDLEVKYDYKKRYLGTTGAKIVLYDVNLNQHESLKQGDFISFKGVITSEEYTGFNMDMHLFAEYFDLYMQCVEITEVQSESEQ